MHGTPNPATTGTNGQAEIELTLGNNASGSYIITATSNGVSTTGTATVTVFSISVISGPGSGAPGDTLTFVVEVQQDGTAKQGETVDFSITAGDGNATLGSTSETTGSNGQAQTTLILGSNASDSYTITATSNGKSVTGTATVTVFSISVISGPGSGAPGDTLTFVVEVQQDGTAKQGETVDFSITAGDGNATLGSTSETTGSNGQAQTTLILGSNASDSYTITATSNGKSVTGTATVTVFSISVISGPGSGAPGDTLTFVVEVQQDGTAKQGETVTFSITSGDGNASLGTPNPATTGSNGQAEIELTLGNNASGSYIITATSNGVSTTGTATVTDNGNPGQTPSTFTITVVSGPGSGAPGDTLTFVVEVRENEVAASGETVNFSITSGDGNASLGSTSETAGHNGQVGQAQTTLILGNNASGSYTIRAELNSDSAVNVSGTATVTTSPPPPQYSLVVISGPGSGAPGDTLTFVVEVRRNGTATSGETVAFSVSPNDGNVTLNPTSDTTGNGGRTQTALTLGNNATGSYIITATNNGNTVTGTATVQTSPPDPRFSIVVVSGPGSGAPGDTLTFVVEVREDGTAAQGETVDFSITAGDGNATLGTPNPATTENNGQAQITITFGNNSTGAYIITATNNGQSVTGTATVTSGNGNGNGNGDGNGDSNGNGDNNGNGNGNSNNGGNNGGSNQQPGSPQRSEPESDEDRRFAFQLDLYAGWNFIHIPLEVTQVDGQSMSF